MSVTTIRRTESVKLKLSAIPAKYAYLRDNEYIHSGYRAGFSFLEALTSCVCPLFAAFPVPP